MNTTGIKTVLYPVTDIAAAKAVYAELLGEPMTDQPYYVGWQLDGVDIGLDPSGHRKGLTGPVAYWGVEDIKAAQQELLAAGGQQVEDVHDVGGGRLIATVKDADGNVIGLLQDPA